MWKKALVVAALLVGLAATAAAERQEWVDASFDFSRPQRIFIKLTVPPEICNGIYENQAVDIFYKKVLEEVRPKLAGKHSILTPLDAAAALQGRGIDLVRVNREQPQEGERLLQNYAAANCDLILNAVVLGFDVGTQYLEGFYQTLPTTNYFEMSDMWGNSVTGSATGTTSQYVPSRNVPVNYACVFFEVKDLHSGNKVWTRVDDRARTNVAVFHNTKPKDLYGRIVGKYFADFTAKLGK